MKLIIDGDLSHFWQWDLNRKIVVHDDGICSEVHFYNGVGDSAAVCQIREIDGRRVADVPNIMLQATNAINVYLYAEREDGSRTRYSRIFNVASRPKPSDYVYTETEVRTWETLEKRVESLEKAVPPNWNASEGQQGHILNRTHYAESEDILPEKTVTFDEEGVCAEATDKALIVGETYVVTWGGKAYECKAVSAEGFVAIGNIELAMGTGDTGEPFGVSFLDGMLSIAPMDGSTSQTVGIYHKVYHKLDNRYLGLDWIPEKTETVILQEQTVVDGAIGAIDTQYRVAGTPIVVYVDGVPHETQIDPEGVDWTAPIIYGGNLCSFHFGDTITYIMGTPLNGHTVKIYLLSPNKLPEEYLPNSVGKVKTVNGIAPDESGNVEVAALPKDAEQIAMLVEADMLPAVHDASGAILSDENGNVILRY